MGMPSPFGLPVVHGKMAELRGLKVRSSIAGFLSCGHVLARRSIYYRRD